MANRGFWSFLGPSTWQSYHFCSTLESETNSGLLGPENIFPLLFLHFLLVVEAVAVAVVAVVAVVVVAVVAVVVVAVVAVVVVVNRSSSTKKVAVWMRF